ncbi:MAG: type I glyceraldehyde-3-phosphate dehydrogenase [Acidobacteria bacterium]|jgi:glyceraldehyde 3-phosphate dehydrogenase|nr:type I glyceraldehyde-3-phosphate dehydrogenase [Acidobacteriota bacterium]MCU0253233.1 type I glyceraldehyde-3-phosphate dehydrogenase [Acidobacteriota bacterium]
MPITIGLMGFGRIGRNVFRLLARSDEFRIGAISDIADPEALTYLLRFDTTFGRFEDDVRHRDGKLYTWGREIPLINARDPGDAKWSDFGVDYVIEATGKPRDVGTLRRHLEAGARRVILCAPPTAKEHPDAYIVYGVNDRELKPEHLVISAASCTAHAAAPALAALNDAFGIECAHLTTIHAYTNAQRLADVPAGANLRNSRAAAQNIIPSETNAAAVIGEVLPPMEGKLTAAALSVPVQNGSIVDLTAWFARPVTREAINELMRSAASGPYREILEYLEDPVVSSDVVKSPYSSHFDSLATMVQEGNLAKVLVWFDNSWGYSHRVIDLVRLCGRQDGKLPEVRG